MPDGNIEQIRVVANAVAESTAAATLAKFVEMHPELGNPVKSEMPPALKFWGAIGGVVAAAAFVGVSGWVVSSVNSMQTTLARIDERQILMTPIQEKRFADLETSRNSVENRLTALEQRKGKP